MLTDMSDKFKTIFRNY